MPKPRPQTASNFYMLRQIMLLLQPFRLRTTMPRMLKLRIPTRTHKQTHLPKSRSTKYPPINTNKKPKLHLPKHRKYLKIRNRYQKTNRPSPPTIRRPFHRHPIRNK